MDPSETFDPWGGEVPPSERTKSHFFRYLEDDGAPGELLIESDPAYESEPVELAPGQVFAGLKVRGRLGSGGMAVVYRAHDPELLLVVDAGHLHDLHLGSPAPPPPGVFRLPPAAVLAELTPNPNGQ